MPGVADKEKKTRLKQEKRARNADMEELALMVKENRLHECDERQLEILKTFTELQNALKPAETPTFTGVDPSLVETLREVVEKAVSNLPTGTTIIRGGEGVHDPDRPSMRHMPADFTLKEDEVSISHDDELGESTQGQKGAASKREQLRKLRKPTDD